VVALESTIISHGLPPPGNLDAARQFEAILADAGVTAATIAIIDGVPKVGLVPQDLERIAADESVVKVSSRDIGIAIARKVTGGTTVAATSVLAARAGIRVFAVGGYQTSRFPAFWLSDSGCDLDWRADSPEEIADIMAARAAFGEQSALLLANPLPPALQLDPGV